MFSLHVLSAPHLKLYAAFECDQQALVKCTWHMDMYRCHLLDLKYAQGGRIMCQPAGYIPANRALWCISDFGLYVPVRVGCSIAMVLVLVASACHSVHTYSSVLGSSLLRLLVERAVVHLESPYGITT